MTEKEVATEKNGQENNGQDNETELEDSIIRQIEYYFGDLNLPRDKFLREQVKLDDGWVPLDVLVRFNRLAKLSTDTELIANALHKSSTGLIEVSDDNKKVRRNPENPIPEMNEERRKELMARTVYAKGFPKDSVLDDLLAYFKKYEGVENVIMRKFLERQTKKSSFKGSVFVTFKTKEQAETFFDTKDLKYGDTELLVRWQEAYLQEKQEEYAARKDKKEKNKNTDTKEEKEELKLPTGTVFHFSPVKSNDIMTRENVREALTALGAEIAYIDFKVGYEEGWVRLSKENTAKEVFEKIPDGKIKICDTEVVFRVLEGDEEKEYLDKTVEEMTNRRKNQKNNKRNKGNHAKGGRQNRKRKQGHHNEAPASKVRADS